MPYFTNVQAEQVAAGPSFATVRVSWAFGNLIPGAVEVRLPGDRVTAPTLLATVPIEDGEPTSCEVILAAPNVVTLVVSPRMVEEGILEDQMPDDAGALQYWETFSLTVAPFTVSPGL